MIHTYFSGWCALSISETDAAAWLYCVQALAAQRAQVSLAGHHDTVGNSVWCAYASNTAATQVCMHRLSIVLGAKWDAQKSCHAYTI
jgi:hypothetical protein